MWFAWRRPVSHADVAMLGSQGISGMTEKNGVFEYSQKLSQQVLTLEADNVELQDAKKVLDADNQLLKAKCRSYSFSVRSLETPLFIPIKIRRQPSCKLVKWSSPSKQKWCLLGSPRKMWSNMLKPWQQTTWDSTGSLRNCNKNVLNCSGQFMHRKPASNLFRLSWINGAVAEGNSLKTRNALEQRLEDMPTVLKLEAALSFDRSLSFARLSSETAQRIGEHEGKLSIFPQVAIAMSGRSVSVLAKPKKTVLCYLGFHAGIDFRWECNLMLSTSNVWTFST